MSWATVETDIKSHLVALVLTVALIFGSVYGVEALISKHDAANNSKWQAELAQVEAKNDQEIAAILTQNTQLLNTITSRNTQLAQIQVVDRALPAPQIAQKLGGTAPDASSVVLPLDIARGITSQLASIPVLTADLKDETTIATNTQTEVDDLKTQLQVADETCKAQVKALNAKSRRSKLKWFIAGIVTGFGLGHVY